MASEKRRPLKNALLHLKQALDVYYNRSKQDELPFLTVSKAFEIAVEYGWRELKRRIEDEGLDAPSPKAAVREAVRLGLISKPDEWLKAIEARNASVHDYFGIGEEDFVAVAESFLRLAANLSK